MFLHKPGESLGKSETEERQVLSYKNGKKPPVLVCVLIIAITLTAIAGTVFLGQKNHRETVRLATEEFNQQQLILARSAATGIETFVADTDDDLLALSSFPVVQKMEPGILERMEVLYMGIPPKTSSRRLDKNGILRFIYPNEGWRKDLIGRDNSHETFFQKAKETREVAISGLVINEVGERRIRIVRPVYIDGEKGAREFNGVIMCSIDPETLSKLFIWLIVSGETGYAWLLNEDGIFLAHHEAEFVGRDAFKVRAEIDPELSYGAIINIQQQMLAGEEGVSRYISGWHRGETGRIEKLVAYTPVRVFDKVWSVAVCAPVDEVERITSKAYCDHLYALGFTIFVLTGAGVCFFTAFYRWTRSLQLIKESKERKRLSKRLIEMLERDRRRIAMGLHDHIGQMLTTLKMDLEMIWKKMESADSPLKDQIETAINKAGQSIKEIKGVAYGLRPSVLDNLGPIPAVRALLNDVKERGNIEIDFFTQNVPQRFEPEKELAVYRIIQEALTNVLKHAHAKRVFLNLVKKNSVLCLSVEDDGVGFEQDKVMAVPRTKSPMGLMIMRERVVQLDGEFSIESRIGGGTHLLAEIPL